MALAEIYGVSTDQLLRSVHPESGRSPNPEQLSPNMTMLPSEGPLEAQARHLFLDTPVPAQRPDEGNLLPGAHAELARVARATTLGS
jgi:hypothetical protein